MRLQYLKTKRKLLVMLASFIIVFTALFALYKLPLSVVLYAALFCLVIGVLFAITDYTSFCRRRCSLANLKTGILRSVDELPEPNTIIEEDYADLLRAAVEEKQVLTFREEREKSEIVDYFTRWAHQIKTPISAMRLILQGEDSEQSRELEAQLFMTEQYVEMVMAYLRMGSDSTDYVLKEYQLSEMIRQSVRKFAPIFIRKRIRLELQPITAKVITDEKWLCFSIEQILSNAVKYTKQGYVSIYTQNETALVIRDTGIGIAPEDLPRIFEKGFTGYNGREDKRASGIGLYLTKQVLTKLGHSIHVESKLDSGTTVRIELGTNTLVPN
jgi:signal transduction histidine kinase